MTKTLLALTAALLISGTAAAQTGRIEIADVWARATPGGATNGAAYLTIRSPIADRLIGVTSPVAERAELHRMTMEGGIMRMRELAALDVPADQPVTLRPGAVHIMLVGLKQPLRPGETVTLTLHFKNAGTREVAAAVGSIGATAPESHAGGATHRPVAH